MEFKLRHVGAYRRRKEHLVRLHQDSLCRNRSSSAAAGNKLCANFAELIEWNGDSPFGNRSTVPSSMSRRFLER